MKRDMDLIREILFAVEKAPFDGPLLKLKIPDRPAEEVVYHVLLLHEAGLIRAFDFSSDDAGDWRPAYLTWEGHEFLEAAKDDTRWNNTKAFVKEKGGPMMFEVIKTVLLGYVNHQVFGK